MILAQQLYRRAVVWKSIACELREPIIDSRQLILINVASQESARWSHTSWSADSIAVRRPSW